MTEGLENLVKEIKSKAAKEKESIIGAAKEEAQKTKSDGREKAEEEKNRILEEGKREAETTKKRILAGARRESRQKKLEAREDLIQKTFDRAKEQLNKLQESERYEEVLKNLIEKGGKTVGGGELKVFIPQGEEEIISDKDLKKISENITEETDAETNLQVDANLSKSKGGAIVERKDGGISCDNTFEARFRRMKSSLRTEVADIIFE